MGKGGMDSRWSSVPTDIDIRNISIRAGIGFLICRRSTTSKYLSEGQLPDNLRRRFNGGGKQTS